MLAATFLHAVLLAEGTASAAGQDIGALVMAEERSDHSAGLTKQGETLCLVSCQSTIAVHLLNPAMTAPSADNLYLYTVLHTEHWLHTLRS